MGTWPDSIPVSWPDDVVPMEDNSVPVESRLPYQQSGDPSGWFFYSVSTGQVLENPQDWEGPLKPRAVQQTNNADTQTGTNGNGGTSTGTGTVIPVDTVPTETTRDTTGQQTGATTNQQAQPQTQTPASAVQQADASNWLLWLVILGGLLLLLNQTQEDDE